MLKSTLFLLRTAGVLSMLYCFIIIVYSGIRTSFLWIWPFVTVCCFSFSAFLSYATKQTGKLWSAAYHGSLLFFWVGFFLLFLVECTLIRAGNTTPAQEPEYILVLGAQVRGDTPSLTLQARIDTAAEYMKNHPSCIAICSGGQGPGENLTEAAAIQRGLIAHGIPKERILLEALSTNTLENLLFCREMITSPDTPITIITSSFHCYRAGQLARKHGYTNVSTLGAGRFLATTPHYYFREFFALIKELLVGNL